MGFLIPLPDRTGRSGPPAIASSGGSRGSRPVYFSREELRRILDVYGRRVATGEWRDYAIDHRVGVAEFSIFRTTHESPVFTIAKRNGKPREYSVTSGRQTLKRGRSIEEVLKVFQRPVRPVK